MVLILLVDDFPKVEIEVLAFADFCFCRRNAGSRRLLCEVKSKGMNTIASLVSVLAKATDAAATATTQIEKNNVFITCCSVFRSNNVVICITVTVFHSSDKRTRPNGTGSFEITATNCGGIPLVHPKSRKRILPPLSGYSMQASHPTSRCRCNFKSKFTRGQSGLQVFFQFFLSSEKKSGFKGRKRCFSVWDWIGLRWWSFPEIRYDSKEFSILLMILTN